MKDLLTIGGRLFIICAVAACALGFVNAITEPITEERKQRELEEALLTLMPQGEPQEPVYVENEHPVLAYYPVESDGNIIGYILSLEENGYAGEMNILAAFKPDGEIISVKLMDNLETPGLGKKAEDPTYMQKFVGKGGSEPVPVRKQMLETRDADAITGATITFIGVSKALVGGSQFVKSR